MNELYLIVYHIIPIWIFFGFLSLLFIVIVAILDSENIVELFIKEYNIIGRLMSCGPLGLMIIIYCAHLDRKKEREQKRKICGWWELKEYGGKY